MRVRTMVTVSFAVAVVGFASWSFYANVLAPQSTSQAMQGMATTAPPTAQTDSSRTASVAMDAETAAVVPNAMAGVQMTAVETGAEALASVQQLHGETLGSGLVEAWVAQYGDASEATLGVSRSPDPDSARFLFTRMTRRISQGNTPFTDLAPVSDQGLEGYTLQGLGQEHFYFLSGTDLYWLAISPNLAPKALADLTERLIATPARVN